MPKEIGTSENNENLPAIAGLNYQDTIASELPVLAAALVHEIKNPLAAIHLHLQLLESYVSEVDDGDLRNRMAGKVQIIKKEILSLNQILQDFFRLIRPSVSEKEVRVNLNDLLSEITDFLDPQAIREGIDLQFIPGSIPEITNTDISFIKQVAINLIINAIQALQKSDRPMEERKIAVRTGIHHSSVFFSVTDNGPGISDEVVNRIFDPFFTTRKEGSGLGLALVKKMINELGGRVEVSSSQGEGTTFMIIFGSPKQIDSLEREV
jgi:signal transduction histidine kinase